MGIPSSTPTIDDFQCFTCDLVTTYHAQSGEFIEKLSETMLGPMWTLFISICGVWVVVQGIKLATNMIDPAAILKDFFFIIIAASMLSAQSQSIILAVFDTTITIMGSASSVVLEEAIQSSQVPETIQGLARLSAVAENGMSKVTAIAFAIADTGSLTNPLKYLYAILLLVPYFILMILYLSQTVIAIFRVTIVAAFSPFLLLTFGFGWGRQMTVAGLKTLLASIIVLFSSSLALGLIMYGVSSLDILNPNNDVDELASLANPTFFIALALGWMGSAFMTEAVGMANSITGSALSNTSAGILTAGLVGSAAAVASRVPAYGKYAGTAAAMAADPKGTAATAAAKAAEIGDRMRAMQSTSSKSFSQQFAEKRSAQTPKSK